MNTKTLMAAAMAAFATAALAQVAENTLDTLAADAPAQSVAAANADAQVEIDDADKVQEAFDKFIESKRSEGFTSYGKAPKNSDIRYYAEMEAVNGIGEKDSEFIQKRQTAFMRAYAKIREDFVKHSVNGRISSVVTNEFLKDKDAERQQEIAAADPVDRLAQKTLALTEIELDRKLEDRGISPAQFTTVADKRKALCQRILGTAATHAFAECSGISVVKTVEGGSADGYTIGVIAKFDPVYVYYAGCIARGVRPQPSAPGIDVGLMLKGDLAQNFGTRFFYDEEGMPALVSFGQWAMTGTPADRTERKLQEKAARLQAEAQANIDMNNFIAGCTVFDESSKGGEEWAKSISYDANGLPVASSVASEIADFISRTSTTKANLGMAGRDVLVSKFITHPDTKQRIAVAAIGWSFASLEAQQRIETIRQEAKRAQPAAPSATSTVAPDAQVPANRPATIREGDTYDF
ncbi:MAG: hypothetical protein IJ802_04570 [Kiritimatiellae bacterium]|nr:hypothetical protein [Kiritimatiellia bacterium]